MRRISMLAVLAAALAVAAIAGPALARTTPRAHAAATTVKLKDSFFAPKSLTVSRGSSVKFLWAGRLVHNLKGRGVPGRYTSNGRVKGSLTVKMTKTGTFSYVCTIHPGMDMKVRVR